MIKMADKQRLVSLDVLRGMTVAGMILVNNGYGQSFAPLGHSKWNGLTPCDLVFPFFLFMVGVSMFISLSRHASEAGLTAKIVKRTVIMFAIGVALHAWDMIVWGEAAEIPGTLRIWGVLQRIALSYCGAALLFLAFKGRHLWSVAYTLLIIYGVILLVGDGYSEVAGENWLAKVDRTLFGNHIYKKALDGRSPVDPEGLVGVIAGIAHTLLGVMCGKLVLEKKEDRTVKPIGEKVMDLLLTAMIWMVCGFVLSYGLPLNKRIWSPSYVLVTCGLAAGLLGVFMWLIDLKGHRRWSIVFQWFGLNALGIYVLSEMLPSVMGRLGISDAIYDFWSSFITMPEFASLCYALTIVAFMALCAWVLYRKKIIIKI